MSSMHRIRCYRCDAETPTGGVRDELLALQECVIMRGALERASLAAARDLKIGDSVVNTRWFATHAGHPIAVVDERGAPFERAGGMP